jgi:hypothetical protein
VANTERMDKVRKANLERRLRTLREAKVINERAQVVIEGQVKKHPTGAIKTRTKTSKIVS